MAAASQAQAQARNSRTRFLVLAGRRSDHLSTQEPMRQFDQTIIASAATSARLRRDTVITQYLFYLA